MKRIIYILMMAVVLTGLASCKKYLDIKPKGKVIPEKTNDYRLLLNQISTNGKSTGFVNSFSNDVLMSDDMEVNPFSVSFYNSSEQNVLTFAEHIYQDFESDPDWEALYNQIYITNLVITEVMQSTGGTDQEKNQLMAEARVHRAHAFLVLVNLYAKQYNPATASADPGVPLRVGLDFEEKLPRASVQEVYNFIINDLTLALGKLPAAPQLNYNYRPTEASADALLARTYLYMNNIAEALKYSDLSIKLYGNLINFNSLQPAQLPGNFQLPSNLSNPEVLLLKSTVSSTSFFYVNAGLVSLYDAQNDLRSKTYFFSDVLFGMNFGFISADWSGKTPAKGPSTAEMYLVRAECYARTGKTGDAVNDLNTLRSFRYKTGSNYTVAAADPAAALVLVKAERRRELAFRGLRYFDIKRYNAFDNADITVTHTLNGATYTLAPGSLRTVLPIGRKYIDLNPEIAQNPR